MVAHNSSDMLDLGGWIIYSAEHSSLSFEGGSSRSGLRRARVTAADHEVSRPHIRSHCCSGCDVAFDRLVEEVHTIQSCAQRVALDCVRLPPVPMSPARVVVHTQLPPSLHLLRVSARPKDARKFRNEDALGELTVEQEAARLAKELAQKIQAIDADDNIPVRASKAKGPCQLPPTSH